MFVLIDINYLYYDFFPALDTTYHNIWPNDWRSPLLAAEAFPENEKKLEHKKYHFTS